MEQNSQITISKLFFDTNPIVIGINVLGEFVMLLATGFILVQENNSVYLIRMLGLNYNKFYSDINKMIDEFNELQTEVKADVGDFPFLMIVKAALNSDRNYWVELSKTWIIKLGREKFLDEISAIQLNKKINQKIRHSFLKLE
ncbi:hypothetical protein [Pedobacter soli]|uniref:Uncharacterized protein n=1 Tax=Pedobacter soli TaxID=390242 RepID=A0A1G6JQ54_9SPHI|nr:hypothetical protein [Pedobacter soli]SDC20808.1 hypothetical protein SAMN04488024_101520 [Pedobacter soli]